ncbi:MAG: Pirin domain protein [Bacteroidota bacterium]|jgi:redox-sensitive bicupin YhaK (pirin superfamily)|nr:Pirin domain protein [Bacteroidota bacterium]
MKTVFHSSNERGHADHGWLNAHHSFSFASYHDPSKVHFGLLRVLNDDIVAPGQGFGMHPHDNMEIVTIPLSGTLEHRDSMGNIGVIKPNEIQAMSAGSGLMHSEYNHSKTEPINLLQIWVFPKERNIKPRYDQKVFSASDKEGKFKTVVAPERSDDVMWINQDAYFSLGKFSDASTQEYEIKHAGNGAYVFVIEGGATINGQKLGKRDAMGISETDKFSMDIAAGSEILVIDVPMN